MHAWYNNVFVRKLVYETVHRVVNKLPTNCHLLQIVFIKKKKKTVSLTYWSYCINVVDDVRVLYAYVGCVTLNLFTYIHCRYGL